MMSKKTLLIASVVAAAVAVNLLVYVFVYAPAVEDRYDLVQEVQELPGWVVTTNVQEAPPERLTDAPATHRTQAVYAWGLIADDGTVRPAREDEQPTEYLVARLEPTDVNVTVTRLKGARGAESAITFMPSPEMTAYLSEATQRGFDRHILFAVSSEQQRSVRMYAPVGAPTSQNTTETLSLDLMQRLRSGEWEIQGFIAARNESRALAVAEQVNKGDTDVVAWAKGIEGVPLSQEGFFSLEIT